MAQDVVIGEEELLAKFQSLSEAVQGDALVHTALGGGTVIVNAAKRNIIEEDLIRTRQLSRSIHAEVKESSTTRAVVEAGTNLEYAAIHEFGGVITPKKASYLAIPVGSYKGSPQFHADLKVRKTPAGNLIMVDGSGTVQYVLKKSVTVPAQPYLRPAFDEHHDDATTVMARSFKQAIMKAAE